MTLSLPPSSPSQSPPHRVRWEKICKERQESWAAPSSGRPGKSRKGSRGATQLLSDLSFHPHSFHPNPRTFKKPGAGGHPQSFCKSKNHSLASGRPGRTVMRFVGMDCPSAGLVLRMVHGCTLSHSRIISCFFSFHQSPVPFSLGGFTLAGSSGPGGSRWIGKGQIYVVLSGHCLRSKGPSDRCVQLPSQQQPQ